MEILYVYLILRLDRTGEKVLALCPAKQEVSMDFHKDFYNFMVGAKNYFKENKEVPWSLNPFTLRLSNNWSLDLKVDS